MSDTPMLPDKLYFKIGEVSRLVGVKPYVLRYWESEFAGLLRPGKTEARHRLYRRKDVETLRTIKRLLHEERYTIEGARRRLRHGVEREVPAPREATVEVPPPLGGLAPAGGEAEAAGLEAPVVEAAPAAPVPAAPEADALDVSAVLARVRRELREICRVLAGEPGAAPPLHIG